MLVGPPPLATQLVQADRAFRAAVAHWDDARALPRAAADAEARQQLIELRLAGDDRLYRVVIPALPERLRRAVVDDVQAHRELVAITPTTGPPLRLGAALPLAGLRALYREGLRRSGVAWQLLAAVNFVETDFGRVRESSASGAQGPMQFMPATWQAYGGGTDVHDPRAAILAAARFLRAAGAPGDVRAALHRYNPSDAYVNAVLRFASRIRRDPKGLAALYARRVFVRGEHGWRRRN